MLFLISFEVHTLLSAWKIPLAIPILFETSASEPSFELITIVLAVLRHVFKSMLLRKISRRDNDDVYARSALGVSIDIAALSLSTRKHLFTLQLWNNRRGRDIGPSPFNRSRPGNYQRTTYIGTKYLVQRQYRWKDSSYHQARYNCGYVECTLIILDRCSRHADTWAKSCKVGRCWSSRDTLDWSSGVNVQGYN